MSNEKVHSKKLFFPYYINQGRLLDIYAILNGGYSEYSEIITAVNKEKETRKGGELEAAGGFKLFNFGSSLNTANSKTDGLSEENREKKVQTVTSVLDIVINTLNEKKYLKSTPDYYPGDFILIPVQLNINSIKSLFEEISTLLTLEEKIDKFSGNGKKASEALNNKKDFKNIADAVKVLFDGEEVFCDMESYAIVGNIMDKHLYQGVRSDIIGTELQCLAQVKRSFPKGAELMKNTVFSKFKDASIKKDVSDALSEIAESEDYDFDARAVYSVNDKPVYQLEIIALFH